MTKWLPGTMVATISMSASHPDLSSPGSHCHERENSRRRAGPQGWTDVAMEKCEYY